MWRWRPAEWPVWNHQIDRAACFWTREHGRDDDVIDALRSQSIEGIQFAEPADAYALRGQVEVERATARRHLASVTNSFGDREWRHDHKGDGAYPEDTLWAAAAGFVELDDWLTTP